MFFRRRGGFTIIEMLTVIAIIGILASIIFPVITAAKRKAYQTQCMNNMHEIGVAFKLFVQDEHRAPDFIAGPVERDGSGNAIPLDKSSGTINRQTVSLYPEYIKSVRILECPLSLINQDHKEYTLTDVAEDPMFNYWANPTSPNTPGSIRSVLNNGSKFELYLYDNYDSQFPKDCPEREAHYSPLWFYVDLIQNPTYPDTDPDYVRQLWWRSPPEDTVVTWCSFHREAVGGVPKEGSKDIVLFLDGHTALISSKIVLEQGSGGWQNAWRVKQNQ